MQNTKATRKSHNIVRIDVQHHALDLMKRAVSRIASGSVDVRVEGGEVVLNGVVNSWHEKQYAQESIRSLTSGRVIRNSVQVSR